MHSLKIKPINSAKKTSGTNRFFGEKKLQPPFFSSIIQRQPTRAAPNPAASTIPASPTVAAPTLSFNPDDPVNSSTPALIDSFTSMVVQSSSLSKYITKSYSPIGNQYKSYNHYHGYDNPRSGTFWNDDWHNAVSGYLNTQDADTVLDIGGFYNRKDSSINLPKDAFIGSAMHEAIHRLGSDLFKSVSNPLNEGVTQYFTDLLFIQFNIPPFTKHNYKAQVTDACKLVQLTNLDLVAKAYFSKDVKALQSILSTLGVIGNHKSGSSSIQASIKTAIDALPAPASCP